MKSIFAIISFVFMVTSSFAQEEVVSDTVQLNEVVYTGQISPQSINKSVYEVQVISRDQIEQAAANNLADLLNQMVNIQVIPNRSTGKSGMDLFGLNSEYVKVLVDNVPLVNDEGLGNFTDFTQLNLEDIEQIEIVEGSMGVEYGANAVAGVINIITNKSAKKLSANLYVQEETIGDEYELFNRGRHIKGINIKSPIVGNLEAGISYNQNDFKGFYNGKQGEKWEFNDSLRGHDWLPKQQYDAKAFLSYRVNSIKLFYRFNYFQEGIQRYDSVVNRNYEPALDLFNPTATDTEFKTQRWYHLLNANGNAWQNAKFNLSLSYQSQDRDANNYSFNILDDSRTSENKFTYESRKTYYGRGTVEQLIVPNKWSAQFGVEANHISGIQSPYARDFDTSTTTVNRDLGSYDIFATTDYKLTDKFTIRPGVRSLFSSYYNTLFAYSFSASYLFSNNWEIRANYGRTPKTPTYEQLYTVFVDSNHTVLGNEDLNAEEEQSAYLHIKKNVKLNDVVKLKSKLSLFTREVKDQISLLIVSETPLEYQFMNFEKFNSRGATFTNDLAINNLTAQLGISYFSEKYASENNDWLNRYNANLLINYHFPKADLHLASNLKYNGKQYQWTYGLDDNGNQVPVQTEQEGYTWWDVSLRKDFLQQWNVVLGVRNLLDITEITTSEANGSAHNLGSNTLPIAYGRSFFAKLTYSIPF